MELDNTRGLLADQLVPQPEVTKRQANYECTAVAVKAAEAAWSRAQATVVQSITVQAEARAAVTQMKATVKSTSFASDDVNIRAPTNSRVEYKVTEVGNAVASGPKMISLLDLNDASMNIFLSTDDISHLEVNDGARIRLGGIDAAFPVKIRFTATDAQFTPKAMKTINERVKLMFKAKLQIPRETAVKYDRPLRGGMTDNDFVKADGKAAWPPELAVKLPQ